MCDDDRRLSGVLNLRTLLAAQPHTLADQLMVTDPISVTAETDQEDAARTLKQYKLLALPVVDEHGHLIGSLTPDDLMDVLEEEATEDMFRLVGVNEDEDLRSIRRSIGHRLPWLAVNLLTVLAAAWVVSQFEDTLARVAVLAAFLPVVGGLGGNAGIQTVTVVVRSLALGRLAVRDTLHVVGRELAAGFVVGVVTGGGVAAITVLWQGNLWLGAIVGFALLVNVIVGVVAGVVIPMTLHRLKQDPALSSGDLGHHDHRSDRLPRVPRSGRGPHRTDRLAPRVSLPRGNSKPPRGRGGLLDVCGGLEGVRLLEQRQHRLRRRVRLRQHRNARLLHDLPRHQLRGHHRDVRVTNS